MTTAIETGIAKLKEEQGELLLSRAGKDQATKDLDSAKYHGFEVAINILTASLPAEQAQIEAAWDRGCNGHEFNNAQDYFSKTYSHE